MAAVAAVSSYIFSVSGNRLPSIPHPHSSPRFLTPTALTMSISPSSPRFQILNIRPNRSPFPVGSGAGDGGFGSGSSGGGGGGNGGDEGSGGKNRAEAILALAEIGRSVESIPSDLAAALDAGRIPGEIVHRFADLEKSAIFRWLMQFGGFRERLLADDLFLAKVAMECGVGIFTKTAAEWERRRENFMKELDFVFADVVDFL